MWEMFPRRKQKTESASANAVEKPDTPEQPREVLHDWDRDIIRRGLVDIAAQMEKDFDGLPHIIVLPDATARPLFYALKPITQRIAERRGVDAPKFYFFKSERPDAVLHTHEMYTDGNTIDTTAQLLEVMKGLGYDENMIETMKAVGDPEKMKIARDQMRARAEEIDKREGRPDIAIVDDYATEQATTAGEIRRAFNDDNIPAYAIFGPGSSEVHVGVQVDLADEKSLNPGQGHSATLTYSGSGATGVRKSESGKYAEAIRNEPNQETIEQRKKMLREELKAIGEQVAATL
jgi:hypothetical protein